MASSANSIHCQIECSFGSVCLVLVPFPASVRSSVGVRFGVEADSLLSSPMARRWCFLAQSVGWFSLVSSCAFFRSQITTPSFARSFLSRAQFRTRRAVRTWSGAASGRQSISPFILSCPCILFWCAVLPGGCSLARSLAISRVERVEQRASERTNEEHKSTLSMKELIYYLTLAVAPTQMAARTTRRIQSDRVATVPA